MQNGKTSLCAPYERRGLFIRQQAPPGLASALFSRTNRFLAAAHRAVKKKDAFAGVSGQLGGTFEFSTRLTEPIKADKQVAPYTGRRW